MSKKWTPSFCFLFTNIKKSPGRVLLWSLSPCNPLWVQTHNFEGGDTWRPSPYPQKKTTLCKQNLANISQCIIWHVLLTDSSVEIWADVDLSNSGNIALYLEEFSISVSSRIISCISKSSSGSSIARFNFCSQNIVLEVHLTKSRTSLNMQLFKNCLSLWKSDYVITSVTLTNQV